METESVISTEQQTAGILSYFSSSAFYATLIIIILTAITVFLIGKLFNVFLKKYKNREAEGYNAGKATLLHMFCSIVKGIAVVFGIIVILSVNGVRVTALITSVSILSAIIGLALQDLMKDLIQGISIIADKFFQVGDVIRYEGINGEVSKVTIRCTKVINVDTKDKVTISNRYLSQIAVASHQSDIDFRIKYEEDVKKVYEIMETVCQRALELNYMENCKFKGIQRFEDSGILYRFRFYAHPRYLPELARQCNGIIIEELYKAGLEINYNHLVLINYDKDKNSDGNNTEE